MSQQNNEVLSDNFMSGTTYHSPAELQINDPIFLEHFGPYRSIPDIPVLLNRSPDRSPYGHSTLQRFPVHQSAHGTTSQHPRAWSEQTSQYRSIPGRLIQYPHRLFQHQYQGSPDLRIAHPTHIPFSSSTARFDHRDQRYYLQPSGTRIIQKMSPPRSVSRQAPPHVFMQNGIGEAASSHLAQADSLPMQPPQHSRSPRPEQGHPPPDSSASQQNTYYQHPSVPSQRPIRIPRPGITDWTTYRINKEGARLPKTTPPPQGTYKVSEGIGKTDYSDPRDFFAPTKEEQKNVWDALKPTREAFYDLTLIVLKVDDMGCLSMGYSAAWDEMKRKLVEWIFDKFSPDRTIANKITTSVRLPSYEIPGYTTEGVRTTVKQQCNPKNIKFFVNGELAVVVEELLPKLERWYGLVEDHRFSPTWPYERESNSAGYLVQNRDCFACMHCRMKQILCHGFREHVDRKCTPCERQGLQCSNEED